MDPLVQPARDFATQMHRRIDHRRKYPNQPDDTHLKAVAELVADLLDNCRDIRRGDPGFARVFIAAADRAIRDIESLRNNLAHGQDIVATDWVTIARLAQNLEDFVDYFPRAM